MSAQPFTRTQEMVEAIIAPELDAPPEAAAVIDRNAVMLVEWERCKGWIEAALKHDGDHYSLSDVWNHILSGNATLWPGKRSAVVAQFWNFPKARCCHLWLAGGDLTELLDEMQPVIDVWAKANGCAEMTLGGRKGWERTLAPHGYEWAFTVLRKRL